MHSSDLVSGYADQAMVEASKPVQANNEEIMRQSAILLRLIKLLDQDGHQESVDELVERVAKRLETSLGIYELYLEKDRAELEAFSAELEKAKETKDVLRVRKEVGDIWDEEYRLKMAVADWGIENYKEKARVLEGSVASMSNLRDQFDSGVVEDIRAFASDDYAKIRDLGLSSELSDAIIRSLGKIAENLR